MDSPSAITFYIRNRVLEKIYKKIPGLFFEYAVLSFGEFEEELEQLDDIYDHISFFFETFLESIGAYDTIERYNIIDQSYSERTSAEKDIVVQNFLSSLEELIDNLSAEELESRYQIRKL